MKLLKSSLQTYFAYFTETTIHDLPTRLSILNEKVDSFIFKKNNTLLLPNPLMIYKDERI